MQTHLDRFKTSLCLLVALLGLPAVLLAQKTYHLGNSLTDTNNGMLSAITQSAGKAHTYLRTTIPGAPTDWIWDHPGSANGEPDYRVVFANQVLDHLFTQPFAGHCRSIDNEADYSGRFFTQARNKNANVQHWLYLQWPSTSLDDCWSKGQGGVNGTAATNFVQAICNFRVYFEKVRDLMDAQQPGKAIRIMPSGLALAKLKIEIEAGRVLGMTDFNTAMFTDGLHLTDRGAYLVSLTHYVGIYGETPVNRVTYKPASLTEQQAAIFRQIAWDVVSDYPWSGLGGSGTLTNAICSGGGGGTPPPPPPPITTTGNVEREYWANVTGTAVSAIPVNTAPTSKNLITSLEGPTNVADNYGTRIRGYIVPSTEGWYTLYIAGDDNAELWFSSGTNPADKARVAHVPGWSNSREWGKYPEQRSSQVYLVRGGKFYFEVLHKEASGGDNVAVAWTGPGITTPTVIGGANLDRYTPPTSGTTTFVSDLTWVSATNGHGPVEKDKSNGETAAGDGRTLTLNGVTYAKGLGVHAASEVVYNLGGAYNAFLSDVGIDDWIGAGTCGTVVFEVYLDNVLAYTSGTMTPTSATQRINLSVAGKNQLKLVVTTAGDNNYCDHADWADARLTSGGARIAAETATDASLQAYPNPARGTLTVDLEANADQPVGLSFLNQLSQPVGSFRREAKKGRNSFRLDVSAYPEGMYFLVVAKDGTRTVRKVVIR